jgi:hypothetical protein
VVSRARKKPKAIETQSHREHRESQNPVRGKTETKNQRLLKQRATEETREKPIQGKGTHWQVFPVSFRALPGFLCVLCGSVFYCLVLVSFPILPDEIRTGELDGAGVVGPGRRDRVKTAAGGTTLYEGLQHECFTATVALKLQAAVWQGRARHLAAVGCQYELDQFPP